MNARASSSSRPSTRGLVVFCAVALAFVVIGGQLVRLGMRAQTEVSLSVSEPVTRSFSRPDIVDRSGRLLATDLDVPSLYADPAVLIDADEVIEKLRTVLGDLDEADLGKSLRDRSKRFVWIRRGLSPGMAQRVHNLGLPGLAFRKELRRAYPMGRIAGHVLGTVNIDNKGLSGIERQIDETASIDLVAGVARSERAPVRLSLDVGVQHGLEEELRAAMTRYTSRGAAGLILDAQTGAVIAAASLPDLDPARPSQIMDEERADKLAAGTYELGSIFKMFTVAMALDSGQARLDTIYDVREPLSAGRFTIKDLHPQNRPLSVAEIFLHSSNVGAGMIALEAGAAAQKAFLGKLGLMRGETLEIGTVAAPQVPQRWDRVETITISYGHGLALAPLQFAAAGTALINGGHAVKPTYVLRDPSQAASGEQVIARKTSARIRELMRLNVTHPSGTGKRADVAGYEVGGKTGTAEMPARGGYKGTSVISSFFAAFPMSAPRYSVLISLFEPAGSEETRNQITAGLNAAPTAGRVISRVAPLLYALPPAGRT